MKRLFLLMVCLLPLQAVATDMGMSTQAVYERMQSQGKDTLFIDVRDPVEIMFIGFTDTADTNIPFRLVDRSRWNEKKKVFQLTPNKDFVAQVDAALKAKGLDRNATIITMCRSGSTRGKPSAEFLRKQGFANAFYVVNGFQGGKVKQGEKKGMRVVNGWQNDGLPWQPKANPAKIYRP